MADEACRIDVWLWRARFCKTRTQAGRLAESGRIRLTRDGRPSRLEKASRGVRPGDELTFALGGRIAAVRILALGARRGPPPEARGLYESLEGDPSRLEGDLEQALPPRSDAAGDGDGDAAAPRRRRPPGPTPATSPLTTASRA
jgi:ribosome-associated heat shock protein Hsp15